MIPLITSTANRWEGLSLKEIAISPKLEKIGNHPQKAMRETDTDPY